MIKHIHQTLCIIALFTMSPSFLCSQIQFERGYIINNDGQKQACWIKNIDWFSNPEEIQYKFSEGGAITKAGVADVKAFGIDGVSKFESFWVNIDRSSDKVRDLSYERGALWSKEQLFLKVLIEGESSLYAYRANDTQRFFYNQGDNIQQLVSKRYLNNSNSISENNRYKQQLWQHVNCKEWSIKQFSAIRYTSKSLEKHFLENNECEGAAYTIYDEREKQQLLSLSVMPSFTIASLQINSTSVVTPETKFNAKPILRLGLELQYILPFNNNTWSVLFVPTYKQYRDEVSTANDNVTLDYTAIEFAGGLRRFFFLRKDADAKLYLDALYISNFSIDSDIPIVFADGNELLGLNENSFAVGVGFNKNKFKFGARYLSSRNILAQYLNISTDYDRWSFYLAYQIL
ncbi:MAG: hypothetical protein AAGI49_06050 [Bacteroidota bacterium]